MLLPSRFSVACIANLAMQFTLAGSYSRYGGYALTDDINIPYRNSLFQAVRDLMGRRSGHRRCQHWRRGVNWFHGRPELVGLAESSSNVLYQ